jgi:hypothetical protein
MEIAIQGGNIRAVRSVEDLAFTSVEVFERSPD